MRIGIDTRDLVIARTGARTYLEEVLAGLSRQAGSHAIIQLQPKQMDPVHGRGAIGKMREHTNFIWWKQVELPRLAQQQGCDVIFCTDFTVPLFASAKTVPVFYDGSFWVNPEHYNRYWRLLMNTFAIPAAKRSPAVVTISEFSRQEIATCTGIPQQRIMAIPIAAKTAASVQLTKTEIELILIRYGLHIDVPFILHVGVLEKRKNLVRLVEAFAQFLNQVDKPYQLVLLGQPAPKTNMDDSENIRNTVERLGLHERVQFTGYVPDADLAAFYQGAKLFAFPSLYEGFGIPILEAFKNQLPVITARSSAIPEVAGDAALLFDPMDTASIAQAMLQVACDAGLCKTLIERGKKRSQYYNWDSTAKQLLALFEQITKGETR